MWFIMFSLCKTNYRRTEEDREMRNSRTENREEIEEKSDPEGKYSKD